MTERTEAEWRELDDRIAREIMGWEFVDRCWVDPNDPFLMLLTHHGGDVHKETVGGPPARGSIWSPHTNVGQALVAMEKILGESQHTAMSICQAIEEWLDREGETPAEREDKRTQAS